MGTFTGRERDTSLHLKKGEVVGISHLRFEEPPPKIPSKMPLI